MATGSAAGSAAGAAARSIAGEFVLLALYPSNDGWRVRPDGMPDTPAYLGQGVAVAQLAELAVMGAVAVEGGQVVATGGEVGGDTSLREVAAQIAEHPGRRSAAWWGRRLGAANPEYGRLLALRESGSILEYERAGGRPRRSRTARYWFVREDDSTVAGTLDRLRSALNGARTDERTTALLAVVHACGLHRAYFKDLARGERETRIRRLTRRHWAFQAASSRVTAIDTSAAT